jgi:hypothetical protein
MDPETWTQSPPKSSDSTHMEARGERRAFRDLARSGYVDTTDPSLPIDTHGDRRQLRSAIGPFGGQDAAMAGPDKGQQVIP